MDAMMPALIALENGKAHYRRENQPAAMPSELRPGSGAGDGDAPNRMDVTAAPFVTTAAPIAPEIYRIAMCPTARPIEDCSSSSAKLRCGSHVNE
jgi:hypothetical protein